MTIIENLLDLLLRPKLPQRISQEEKDKIVSEAKARFVASHRRNHVENTMLKREKETR